MLNKQKWGLIKYPIEAALFASLLFIFIIFFFYLRDEHQTHLAYVDAARHEKVDQLNAEYKLLVSLLKNFVYFNGQDIVAEVKTGRSLASLNFNFFIQENPAVVNLYIYDKDFNLVKQFKKNDKDGDRVRQRLRDVKFIEGYVFENTDEYYQGEGIHKIYFPVPDEGYLVFILGNDILERASVDKIYEITFYNEGFYQLAGTNTRTPGEVAEAGFSQLLVGENPGIYSYKGKDFSFGHILLLNGTIYMTVYAPDENRSHLIFYTLIVFLLIIPVVFLLCRGLIHYVGSRVLGKEIVFEYDDPVIKRLERTIKINIANANRVLESHLDVQVLKEDLIECREQLSHRRIKQKP